MFNHDLDSDCSCQKKMFSPKLYCYDCHCKAKFIYVTRFYKTDPNRTSGKIKLTPPVDSYTIVLVVLTLSTTQTTRGWFQQTSFLGGV